MYVSKSRTGYYCFPSPLPQTHVVSLDYFHHWCQAVFPKPLNFPVLSFQASADFPADPCGSESFAAVCPRQPLPVLGPG